MRDVMVTFHVTFYASVGVYFHIFPINWNISSAFHLQMNTMNNFTEHVFIDFFHFVLVQPDSDKTLHCLLNGEEKVLFEMFIKKNLWKIMLNLGIVGLFCVL